MAAAVLTAALLLPLTPHTGAELDDWYADWLTFPPTADVMGAALVDMKGRHPCFPDVCLAAAAAPSSPVPAAAPSAVYSSGVEQWRSMVAHFWPVEHVDRMLRIMACESGGDPNAHNTSTDVRGLFQVRYPLWSKVWPGDYFDPWTNAAVAYQVWLEQGYRAWACKA